MSPQLVLGRIDSAAAGRGTEFSHGLEEIRTKTEPMTRLGVFGAGD